MNAKMQDVRTSEDDLKAHKNIQKVLLALENDPFGLSVSQIANNTRLSVKTVQNVLATQAALVVEKLGVYHLKQKSAPEEVSQNSPDQQSNKIAEPVAALPEPEKAYAKDKQSTSSEKSYMQPMDINEPTVQPEIEDPLADYKAMIETVVIQKKSVNLNMRQLTELLQDVFGLKNVSFYSEGSAVDRVAVILSDEVVI